MKRNAADRFKPLGHAQLERVVAGIGTWPTPEYPTGTTPSGPGSGSSGSTFLRRRPIVCFIDTVPLPE